MDGRRPPSQVLHDLPRRRQTDRCRREPWRSPTRTHQTRQKTRRWVSIRLCPCNMLQSRTVIHPASTTKHTLFNKENMENLHLIALLTYETTYVSGYETEGFGRGNFSISLTSMKLREGVILGRHDCKWQLSTRETFLLILATYTTFWLYVHSAHSTSIDQLLHQSYHGGFSELHSTIIKVHTAEEVIL